MVTSAADSDVTTGAYERMFVIMGLRWEQERDGGDGSWWGWDDTDRMVASVWRRWNGVGRWTWVARWWGYRPPDALGITLGRDTTIVAEDLDDAHTAMAAVEAHIATRDPNPPRQG